MNNVNIIGRVTAAPEVRYTNTGTAVGDVNLAVDDGFGEQKKTFFFNVVLWGKTAENAAEHLVKGQRIGVTGRLTQEEYTPRGEEKPVRKTRITCERLTYLDKPKDAQGGGGQQRQERQERPAQQPPASQQEDEDDIPF